ncbi:hypothetical protein PF005_g29843, partial [Phytophthora fragariae]
MTRKWFQVKDEDGGDLISADAASVGIEDVAAFRDAVKDKYTNILATVDAPDFKVFANGAAYDAKQEPLQSSASLLDLGKDEANALIVAVTQRAETAPTYFILPETRVKVAKAVFGIVEEDKDHNGVGVGVFQGVGIGVFFSATLAVTCDHNLTEQDTVGSSVTLALKEEMANVEVVARNAELDFAILERRLAHLRIKDIHELEEMIVEMLKIEERTTTRDSTPSRPRARDQPLRREDRRYDDSRRRDDRRPDEARDATNRRDRRERDYERHRDDSRNVPPVTLAEASVADIVAELQVRDARDVPSDRMSSRQHFHGDSGSEEASDDGSEDSGHCDDDRSNGYSSEG